MERRVNVARRRLGTLEKNAERAQTAMSFPEKVYAVVRRIPRGKVASYGMVALLAGRMGAARAVGRAMRGVPRELKLPCHRVIKSDGSLTEAVFGGRQRGLLKREGVAFRKDGRVDMARCEWEG
jgi:methylated-DNA-protein-cysteine methyltransferase-like protein